jgi:hypothetical protein
MTHAEKKTDAVSTIMNRGHLCIGHRSREANIKMEREPAKKPDSPKTNRNKKERIAVGHVAIISSFPKLGKSRQSGAREIS